MGRISTLLLMGVCVVFAILYGYGGVVRLEKVNTDLHSEDQGAVMWYAKELHDRNLLYPGDGNRSPLYPFIQSLFHGRQTDWESFLAQGKSVHLVSVFRDSCRNFLYFSIISDSRPGRGLARNYGVYRLLVQGKLCSSRPTVLSD